MLTAIEHARRTQQSLARVGWFTFSPALAQQMHGQMEALRHGLMEPAIEAAAAVAETRRESLPNNWRGLSASQLTAVLRLAETGAVATVWAPRLEITVALADAPTPAARSVLLISRRTEILDDADDVLADCIHFVSSEHSEARDQAVEAMAAARGGFDRAAQSLLAAAFTHLMQATLGFVQLADARREFEARRDLDDTLLAEIRVACPQLASANALTNTENHTEGFNRHGTQHGMPAFFSQEHMLGSALLVCGWIRELSWIKEHRPDLLRETP